MEKHNHKDPTRSRVVLLITLFIIVAGTGYWWYTSSLIPAQEPSPEPSPSPTHSPTPTYTYVRYSKFGFSFEHPEGMVFTIGALTGGFDHAHPASGDVQGVLEEIPEAMGVIWLPSDSDPQLDAVLDELFASAEASGSIQVLARGALLTSMKDDQEMVYQYFNITNAQGVPETGVVGVWYSDEDERVYALYLVTTPEVAREDLQVQLQRFVDSFVSESWEASSGELEPYWPTVGWRYARPEDVGIDPARLDEMIEVIKRRNIGIDSVMVIRDGYVVMDAYFPPFDESELHIIYSCTKSVVSTLIAIALKEGYIESLDQRLLDFFPYRTIQNLDPWKEAITLRDLLTMTAGFNARDSYLYNWEGLERMHESDEPLQYVLDLPMAEEPGTRFEYTNGVSHLLSCIIMETTGMSALEFAEDYLFGPLGITDVEWDSDSQGRNWGYSRLYLKPHDMAKIGYLFLNEGQWDGEQIVPQDWVEDATAKHIDATIMDGYGYQWWVNSRGYYSAVGHKGQFIHVVPELQLVAVFTSRNANDFDAILSLLDTYIIPAVIQ